MSPAQAEMTRLAKGLGELAHKALDVMLDKLSFDEQIALACDWREFWARPNQVPPASDWDSWGWLGGRGLGKTISCSKEVNNQVEHEGAMLVGICAQDEANCVAVQVNGPSGLIATASPWFKPVWEAAKLELVWPNGARAYVRTPEVPGKIRGLEYHVFWATEIQSWPVKTRDEAWANVVLSTRLGRARILWDATPKKRHPILKKLLASGVKNPPKHVVMRGATQENAANLASSYMARLDEEMGGTQRGKEELEGEMLDDSESALVQQEWIDRNRRAVADALLRRCICVDPAITKRSGSDQTGIIDVGLSAIDSKVLVMGDRTGKYTPSEWGLIVLDLYVAGECDLVIVETNKGGDLLVTNLRACAGSQKLKVIVVDDKWRPQRVDGVVFVREVYGRGSKEDRAKPLSTAYERNRVCHVGTADLAELEDTLTTWEPAEGRSPDRLDPLVYGVIELLGLDTDAVDPRDGFKGIAQAAATLHQGVAAAASPNIARILGRGGPDRI